MRTNASTGMADASGRLDQQAPRAPAHTSPSYHAAMLRTRRATRDAIDFTTGCWGGRAAQ
jgi:hypothetical protein